MGHRAFALLFLCFSTLSHASNYRDAFDTPLGKKYQSVLHALVVFPEVLPPSCRLAREVGTAPIYPATTNPYVTDDARLITFASQIGFGQGQFENVNVALSALYYSGTSSSEVGIWGLYFKNENAAAAAYSQLKHKAVLFKGPVILTVWTDDESGKTCRDAIERSLKNEGFRLYQAKP